MSNTVVQVEIEKTDAEKEAKRISVYLDLLKKAKEEKGE